jgi:hypothetical protein
MHGAITAIDHHESHLAAGELAKNSFEIGDLSGLGVESLRIAREHGANARHAHAVAPAAWVAHDAHPHPLAASGARLLDFLAALATRG